MLTIGQILLFGRTLLGRTLLGRTQGPPLLAGVDIQIRRIAIRLARKMFNHCAALGGISLFETRKKVFVKRQIVGMVALNRPQSGVFVSGMYCKLITYLRLDQACKINHSPLRIVTDQAYFKRSDAGLRGSMIPQPFTDHGVDHQTVIRALPQLSKIISLG